MKLSAGPICVFLLLWLGVAELAVGQSKPGEAHLAEVKLPPIAPAGFEGAQTTIKLPGSYTNDVVTGGGGRYLIFQLLDKKQLAIFDVVEAKIVKLLDVDSDDLSVTAGADKLVVLLRNQNKIERYSLQTFEKELSLPLAADQPLAHITMGSASNGPILVGAGGIDSKHQHFLDLQTLKPSAIQMSEEPWPSSVDQDCQVSASANGQVFCVCRTDSKSAPLTMAIVVKGNQAISHKAKTITGMGVQKGGMLNIVLPDAEGKLLYTHRGVCTQELTPLEVETEIRPVIHAIPAARTGYCISVVKDTSSVAIHAAGNSRVIQTIPEIWTKDRWPDYEEALTTAYQRLHFVPGAHVILFLPASREEIVLNRFDLDAALNESGEDYLYATSFPERFVERGDSYEYQIDVRSNRGPLKYQLSGCPVGMSVSPEGLLKWEVPPNSTSDLERVFLYVGDQSDRMINQSFRIHVAYKAGVLGKPPEKPDKTTSRGRGTSRSRLRSK